MVCIANKPCYRLRAPNMLLHAMPKMKLLPICSEHYGQSARSFETIRRHAMAIAHTMVRFKTCSGTCFDHHKYPRNYVAAVTAVQIQGLKTIISTIAALVAAAISAATLVVVVIVRRPPACRTLN